MGGTKTQIHFFQRLPQAVLRSPKSPQKRQFFYVESLSILTRRWEERRRRKKGAEEKRKRRGERKEKEGGRQSEKARERGTMLSKKSMTISPNCSRSAVLLWWDHSLSSIVTRWWGEKEGWKDGEKGKEKERKKKRREERKRKERGRESERQSERGTVLSKNLWRHRQTAQGRQVCYVGVTLHIRTKMSPAYCVAVKRTVFWMPSLIICALSQYSPCTCQMPMCMQHEPPSGDGWAFIHSRGSAAPTPIKRPTAIPPNAWPCLSSVGRNATCQSTFSTPTFQIPWSQSFYQSAGIEPTSRYQRTFCDVHLIPVWGECCRKSFGTVTWVRS